MPDVTRNAGRDDPRVLSLCSGYGGLDLAVEQVLGAVTVAHAEIEPAACRVLEARWPGVPNIGNVKEAGAWYAHRWRGLFEIITAGYPCQPFSHAGRRKGTDDPRHLWPYVAATIRGVRPGLVVLENVAGHRTLGFDRVLADLAALGYDATWTCLRAADVGAPHGRERLFIVAADTGGEADRLGSGLRASGPAGQWRGRPDDDRVSEPAAHADVAGSQGRESAGRLDLSARRAAADAECGQLQRRRESGAVGSPAAASGCAGDQRKRDGHTFVGRGAVAADVDRVGLEGVGRQFAERCDADGRGGADTVWGNYESAVRRWERILGRVAPAPTEPGSRGGQRLSPRFVEWMMGLPAGWVTGVPGVSRNEQLKMLGNGVVPQQAAEALRRVLAVEWAA